MVGREAELGHLHSLFAKALRGERQVVFITGEAGIGKTTLVDAFLAQIRESRRCPHHFRPVRGTIRSGRSLYAATRSDAAAVPWLRRQAAH